MDKEGKTICRRDVYVMEYGKIACWSKITYWEEAIDVQLVIGENKYDCASEDTTRCQIKQENSEKLWP